MKKMLDYYEMRKVKKHLLSVLKARETEKRFSRLKLPPPERIVPLLNAYKGVSNAEISTQISELSLKMKELRKGV